MPSQCKFNANSMPMPMPIECNNNAIQCRFDAITMPFNADAYAMPFNSIGLTTCRRGGSLTARVARTTRTPKTGVRMACATRA
eukprot:11187584-Lingulodinium_polyedra.AAC.1